MAEAADYFVNPQVRRREADRPPPLSVWLWVAGVVAAIVAATAVYFAFLARPVNIPSDAAFFNAQMDRLEREEQAYRSSGQRPLSIVFVGTSRIKNATFDPAQVARSAKASGIQRPVASTYLAINWGGFERLQPAVNRLLQDRPDVVVMMPELFVEDFNYRARARLGFRHLQGKVWSQDYKLFGDSEFYEPACSGFHTIEDRIADHRSWISDSTRSRGPAMAREAVRQLTSAGTRVLIADVPTSAAMTAKRPAPTEQKFLRDAQLPPGAHTIWLGQPLPNSAYCDWAHVDPKNAAIWQQAFFSRAAGDLNAIGR